MKHTLLISLIFLGTAIMTNTMNPESEKLMAPEKQNDNKKITISLPLPKVYALRASQQEKLPKPDQEKLKKSLPDQISPETAEILAASAIIAKEKLALPEELKSQDATPETFESKLKKKKRRSSKKENTSSQDSV